MAARLVAGPVVAAAAEPDGELVDLAAATSSSVSASASSVVIAASISARSAVAERGALRCREGG